MKTWILPVDGEMCRVVLEKDTLDIWVNGKKVEVAAEFTDDGTVNSVSSVVELKMVRPKMQAFCPRIDMLKGNRCILKIRGASGCQKVPKSYFQSQCCMSKIDGTFSKKKSFKSINLGDHFFVNNIFF